MRCSKLQKYIIKNIFLFVVVISSVGIVSARRAIDITKQKISFFGGSSCLGLIITENGGKKYFKSDEEIINESAGIRRLRKNSFFDYNEASYKYNRFVQYCRNTCIPIDKGQNIATRNVATTKIAQLFDVSYLIAKSEYVDLVKGGKLFASGSLMDTAKGISFFEFKSKKNKTITPEMQKNLTSLQIIDSICAQGDRVPWNYNIICNDKGEAINVQCFDNDLSFGTKQDVKTRMSWLPPMVKQNGDLNLPHISKELAIKIINTDDKEIEKVLSGILDKEYILATQNRFNQVKNGIIQSSGKTRHFLLSSDKWSNDTVKDELNDNFKESYLNFFYSKL